MPSDFNSKTILQYAELNEKYSPNKVIETYGQMTFSKLQSAGQPIEMLQKINLKQLDKYVCFSNKHGIGFNYTINSACLSNYELTDEGILSIQKLIMDLYNIGIDTFTVTLPKIIEIIQSLNIKSKIVVSTICKVASAHMAIYYKNMNVSRIVLDVDVTRNFKEIKNISKIFGGDIELITNTSCIRGCPFKIFHYNANAHSKDFTEKTFHYYNDYCKAIKEKDALHYIKMNWIRPEDIPYYTELGVNYFKLQGRTNIARRNLVKTAEHYLSGEYFGNLLVLLELFKNGKAYKYYLDNKLLDGYVKTLRDSNHECTGICNTCSLCSDYFQKALKSL